MNGKKDTIKMAHCRGTKFLEMKLTFLEEQQQQLDSLIYGTIDKCRSYLSGGANSPRCSFKEMNQMIEDTVEIVTRTITQIEVDKSELMSHESRMNKMETAMTAITDNVEMLMMRQTNIENGMGDLSVKCTKTEDKWMKQLNQVDSKMIDLRQREDEFVKQHEREIQSLTDKNKVMKNSVAGLKKGMEDLSVKQSKTEDKWMKQFKNVDSQMIDLRQKEDALVKQHGKEIQILKDENKIIKHAVADLKKGMEDLSVKQPKTEDKWTKQLNQVDSKMIGLRQKVDEFVQQHNRDIQILTGENKIIKYSVVGLKKGMEDLSVKQRNTEDMMMKLFSQASVEITDLKQKEDSFVQRHDREIRIVKGLLQTARTSQDELERYVAREIGSKQRWQATLENLQQDMAYVQVDVQKLRDAIQKSEVEEVKGKFFAFFLLSILIFTCIYFNFFY